MKGPFAVGFFLLTMSLLSPSLSAKGDMVKISIRGGGLTAPIEITNPKINAFNVWAGPGVVVNGAEQREGFIIEWPKGAVAHLPAGLQRYEVSFYEGREAGEPSLVYVVDYACDPLTGKGFVYLPGRGDERFRFNRTMWHGQGLEGNWFRATDAWDAFVRPLIAPIPG